ncbi:hypothetical protein ACFC7A_08145 [Streptomyces niveus]
MRKRRAADRDRALSQLYIFTRRTPHMNVITNLLAGLVHFVGWLV